jgi:hypothetical protein
VGVDVENHERVAKTAGISKIEKERERSQGPKDAVYGWALDSYFLMYTHS